MVSRTIGLSHIILRPMVLRIGVLCSTIQGSLDPSGPRHSAQRYIAYPQESIGESTQWMNTVPGEGGGSCGHDVMGTATLIYHVTIGLRD